MIAEEILEKIVTKEFLEKNGFEKEKVSVGLGAWRYEDESGYIRVVLGGCGEKSIYIDNKVTHKSLYYTIHHNSNEDLGFKLSKEEFKSCMNFMGIAKEFDYDN